MAKTLIFTCVGGFMLITYNSLLFVLAAFAVVTVSYFSYMNRLRTRNKLRQIGALSHDTVYSQSLTNQGGNFRTTPDQVGNYNVDGVSYDQNGTIVAGDNVRITTSETARRI